MGDVVLKVENLSKQYRLGEVGTGTLSHDLNRWWARIRGKEDPYSVVGQVNDRTKKADSDFVWALKDINFEVKKGEVLGIIGKNGAGKSTLLKLISRITAPTTGFVKAKGRVASLLEVGTGMHPEMTARENIYLNGAIMGMTKKEITRKFDEIIDFAGCRMYVDTPVKRFSSGMRVRLGFAVAAFLEPEILIVDEVLAVGDAEFQKKAVGKMKEVSGGDGRTVLFVSHNMASVRTLCTSTLVLSNGTVAMTGTADEAIQYYLSTASKGKGEYIDIGGGISIQNLVVGVPNNAEKMPISGGTLALQFSLQNASEAAYKNIRIVYDVLNEKGLHLFRLVNQNAPDTFNIAAQSSVKVTCQVDDLPLNDGTYFLSLRIKHGKKFLLNKDSFLSFRVNAEDFFGIGRVDRFSGSVLVRANWTYTEQ